MAILEVKNLKKGFGATDVLKGVVQVSDCVLHLLFGGRFK